MNKLFTSLSNSMSIAVDFFTRLPWWLQLIIALAVVLFVIDIFLKIYNRLFNQEGVPNG